MTHSIIHFQFLENCICTFGYRNECQMYIMRILTISIDSSQKMIFFDIASFWRKQKMMKILALVARFICRRADIENLWSSYLLLSIFSITNSYLNSYINRAMNYELEMKNLLSRRIETMNEMGKTKNEIFVQNR